MRSNNLSVAIGTSRLQVWRCTSCFSEEPKQDNKKEPDIEIKKSFPPSRWSTKMSSSFLLPLLKLDTNSLSINTDNSTLTTSSTEIKGQSLKVRTNTCVILLV